MLAIRQLVTRHLSLVTRKGADAMEDLTKRLSRRSFLRALGAAGGAAIAGSVLAACGGSTTTAPAATSAPAARAPTAARGRRAPPARRPPRPPPRRPPKPPPPRRLPPAAGRSTCSGRTPTNARTPLIEDFTKATGIKVNQTIVQYNAAPGQDQHRGAGRRRLRRGPDGHDLDGAVRLGRLGRRPDRPRSPTRSRRMCPSRRSAR